MIFANTDAIQPAFDALLGIVDEVFPVEFRDVENAKVVVLGRAVLSARDALHVAVMERHRVRQILSFDAGFDAVPGVTRLPAPAARGAPS
ncbi:MAG: PIN domain-containing protein [Candidatus Rokubacteria bacterium]|nr:PIN domain-containing protein [Candidatus Rokubacteria bacterium]